MAKAEILPGVAKAETRHYATLDGLRGIAAVAVVVFHGKTLFGPLQPGSAYLAVDFFFALSGFVIAHAYDKRFEHGLSGGDFLRSRVVRLFPLYLAGTAIAAAAAAAAVFILHDAEQWTAGTMVVSLCLATVMVPSPFTANLFPLDDACWSLFFEFLANGVYASRLWQAGWFIWLVPGFAAIGLLFEAVVCGSLDRGAAWGDPWWSGLVWGGLRVAYSFPLGLLLYRRRADLRVPRVRVGALALVLATLLWIDPQGVWRVAYDVGFVLVVSPMIVLLGCRGEPTSSHQAVVCRFLGSISYPIYVLHRPITNVVDGAIRRLPHSLLGPDMLPVIGVALLCVLFAVSAGADRLDLHARRSWLAQRRSVGARSPIA